MQTTSGIYLEIASCPRPKKNISRKCKEFEAMFLGRLGSLGMIGVDCHPFMGSCRLAILPACHGESASLRGNDRHDAYPTIISVHSRPSAVATEAAERSEEKRPRAVVFSVSLVIPRIQASKNRTLARGRSQSVQKYLLTAPRKSR